MGRTVLRRLAAPLALLLIGGAIVWFGADGSDALDRVLAEVDATLVAGIVLALLALPVLMSLGAARTRYHITDRRLVETSSGGSLRWSLMPEHVHSLDATGRGLRLSRQPRYSSSREEDAWFMFRDIGDVAGVADRVEEWLAGHDAALRDGARHRSAVTSPAGGFTIEIPDAWTTARHRVDDPGDAARLQLDEGADDAGLSVPHDPPRDWNVLVARGPHGARLAVESYEGAPPPDRELEGAAAFLVSTLGPATVEEEAASLGGGEGRRVRREFKGYGAQTGGGTSRSIDALVDEWTLTAGSRWYRITAAWSRALPSAGEAVRSVVDTFRVTAPGG